MRRILGESGESTILCSVKAALRMPAHKASILRLGHEIVPSKVLRLHQIIAHDLKVMIAGRSYRTIIISNKSVFCALVG